MNKVNIDVLDSLESPTELHKQLKNITTEEVKVVRKKREKGGNWGLV
jgi:hypothetical protein